MKTAASYHSRLLLRQTFSAWKEFVGDRQRVNLSHSLALASGSFSHYLTQTRFGGERNRGKEKQMEIANAIRKDQQRQRWTAQTLT